MSVYIDYFLVFICGWALIINMLRVVKIIFNPAIMSHPVFDFPNDKTRRVLILLCTNMVLLYLILTKLSLIG